MVMVGEYTSLAFLLPAGGDPTRRAGVPGLTLAPRTTFDTPWYGRWTLYLAALPAATNNPPSASDAPPAT